MKYKFGFIGSGNMGSALCSAICKKVSPTEVSVCDKDSEKAALLAEKTRCVNTDLADLVKNSEYIFLAVKPQGMSVLFDEMKEYLCKRSERLIFVTMAAGMSSEKILTLANGDYPIIRIMPNTPVAAGEGMILYAPSEKVSENEFEYFVSSLEYSGKLARIEEKDIDSESIITGCGPAYVFMFIDALAKAAENLGVAPETARLYAVQTVIGAAKLALGSDKTLTELKEAVCSKGGTTIEGVKVLEAEGLYKEVSDAAQASYKRTLELAK